MVTVMVYTPATLEQIDKAIFQLIVNSFTFKTFSRRLLDYNRVPAEAQPAAFLATGDLEPRLGAGTPGMPYKWKLHRKIWLYANGGNDDTIIPSSLMNPILNAVFAAFKPTPPGDRQTLGGIVYNVSFSGRIMTDEGLLGPQAVAVIPVEVLTGEIYS